MRRRLSLYVEGHAVDLQDDGLVLWNWLHSDLYNPAAVRNSYSHDVTLPGTRRNDDLFGGIFRADRRLGSPDAPGDNYRAAFDPSKRADFAIYDEAGQIVVAGYCRLDRVVEQQGVHTYSLALFGGLGGFLYEMSYNDDGSKKSLADLDYGTDLDFVIDKDAVADAWARLAGDSSKPDKWDVINFAPAYNGIPDHFDADKAVADPDDVGLADTVDGHTTRGGYCLVNLSGNRDEWAVRDLRSYLQRPVVSMRAVFAAIAASSSWDVDYSDIEGLPYLDTWLTRPLLPSLGTFKQIDAEVTASYVTGGWTSGSILGWYTLAGAPAGTKITIRSTVSLSFQAPSTVPTLHSWKREATAQGYRYEEQVLILRAVGYAADSTVVAQGVTTLVYDAADFIPAQDVADVLGITGDVVAVKDGDYTYGGSSYRNGADIPVEVSGANIATCRIEVSAAIIEVYQGLGNRVYRIAAPTASPFRLLYDGSTAVVPTLAAITSQSVTATQTSPGSLRSGARVTKEMLLSTSKTPAEYLVSFCKAFGCYIVTDAVRRRVEILRRETFFQAETIDLTDRVNRLHELQMEPLAFSRKWYELKHEGVGGRFADEYLQVEGVQYGVQRIDTGYDFDAQTYDILSGSALRSAAAVMDRSRYWFRVSAPAVPAVFLDGGNTYTLWDGSGASLDTDIPVPDDSAVLTPYNADFPGYDAASRAEFRDADNKALDGADVLLLLDGSDTLQDFKLTDDLPVMDTLLDGPCWILAPDPVGIAVPRFSRYVITGGTITLALDFGTPRQIDIPGVTYDQEATVYRRRWRTFMTDRLHVDNKILRCRVDFRGLTVSGELLRKFYWYRNSLWVLGGITNYSLTTFDPAECELVQVRDIDNYTT